MEHFKELELSEQMLKNLEEKGYQTPTDIQASAIPPIIAKKDVVLQSHTGSGKTASFGIPLINNVMADVPAVQFVVLVPTRELAAQVRDEFISLAKDTGVSLVAIYGGADMSKQITALRNGAQIVVGTPGRILDHLKRRTMNFSVVRGIVLDEADKMLSMGFLPDVQSIFSNLPKRRQVVMSSATFPFSVEQLILQYMVEPEKIILSSDDVAPKEVEHLYCSVNTGEKEEALLAMLEKEQPECSLIFCNTKTDVKSVTYFLAKTGARVEGLSSDFSQSQREKTLRNLRTGRTRHMVCTDLAARGIDIPHLSHVFLFASSGDSETYVHRSGRTGRAGKAGKAISLVATHDLAGFRNALKVNGIDAEEIKPPTEEEIVEARIAHHYRELEKVDFAKDADVQEEYTRLADKLTPEQVKTMLPILLEHFHRPYEPPTEQAVPELLAEGEENREPAGRGDRDRGRGRGRDRERGRDRDRDRGRGRGRDRDRDRDRGGDRDRDRDRDRGRGRGRDRDRDRDRDKDRNRESDNQPGNEPQVAAQAAKTTQADAVAPSVATAPSAATASAETTVGKSKDFVTVCLALGRRDGIDEMDIQNILRRQGRARMEDIGDITMKDHESFINIGSASLEGVLAADGRHFKSFELYIGKSPVALESVT